MFTSIIISISASSIIRIIISMFTMIINVISITIIIIIIMLTIISTRTSFSIPMINIFAVLLFVLGFHTGF